MAKPIRTIDVYPNPFAGIAEDGMPQGVCQMPGTRNYIGAHLDQVACEQTGKSRFYYAAPQEGETGVMGLRKVTVPFTAEIARAVLEGGLIVADAEHARMCGLAGFIDAATQLKAERARAESEQKAHYGDGAEILDFPTIATPRPDAVIASTPTAKPDPRSLPLLKGTPMVGPANNPSLVIRPAPAAEGT